MIVFYLFLFYLSLGLLFSIPFLTRWITKLDDAASGTSWKFRLLLLPGCLAFWPVLLRKLVGARKHPGA